jgi:hypothetical protein
MTKARARSMSRVKVRVSGSAIERVRVMFNLMCSIGIRLGQRIGIWFGLRLG